MTTIWKYQLASRSQQMISMPSGAKILDIQVQGGNPCLWALVNSDHLREERTFIVLGTGHSAPTNLDPNLYIGSFQLRDGTLVFHVFESKELTL